MLTGTEIIRQIELGGIKIDPFNPELVNPNSIDVCLGDEMREVRLQYINGNGDSELESIPIFSADLYGRKCFDLLPGRCYLGTTLEKTETRYYIPMINGKSTLGRRFIQIHQTAGFGDIGFSGQWTLEITVAFPTRLYVGERIAQIAFFEPVGNIGIQYSGKYQGQLGPTAAR